MDEASDTYHNVWKCTNCGHETPRRVFDRNSAKVTPSQERTLGYLHTAFGGEIVKRELIGRGLWIEIENTAREWYNGKRVCGMISVQGSFDIALLNLSGDINIKTRSAVQVWLRDGNPAFNRGDNYA